MIIKDVLQSIGNCLVGCVSARYTGQVVFTLHFRQGGIAKASVKRESDLSSGAAIEAWEPNDLQR